MKNICMILFASILLSGCAFQTQLVPKNYQGSVSVSSGETVRVENRKGIISSDSSTMQVQVNGNITPITSSSPDSFNFNEEDQDIFTNHLELELVRLGLFNAKNPDNSSTIQIIIEFKNTHFDPNINQYIVDVDLRVYRNDKEIFISTYHIDSAEGDTYWEKVNATGPAAKIEISNKLQEAIILDLEKWISNSGHI